MQTSISRFFTKKPPPKKPPSSQSKSSSSSSNAVIEIDSGSDTAPPSPVPDTRPLFVVTEDNEKRQKKFRAAIKQTFRDDAPTKGMDYSLLGEEAAAYLNEKASSKITATKYTPLEQQVLQIRKTHPDSLLMIEVGYKMRFFGDDAVNAAKVLSIYAHQDHNFMVGSIPTFRTFVHCKRLVEAGYKVTSHLDMKSCSLSYTHTLIHSCTHTLIHSYILSLSKYLHGIIGGNSAANRDCSCPQGNQGFLQQNLRSSRKRCLHPR